MNKDTLRKVALTVGPTCLVLAAVILIYADGLRRWYSGLFFALIGAVLLLNARHRK